MRAVEVTPLPGAPNAVLGIISVAGDIVPVCDLRARFGHPTRSARATDHLAIVHTSRRRLALLVDAPVEVTNATAVKITAPPAEILERSSLRGAVQLVDGIVLIHDLERFLSTDDETALDAALVPHAPGASASAQ